MSTRAPSTLRRTGADGSREPSDRASALGLGLSREHYVLAVVVVVVVALVLRLYHLGAQSFWIDEISVTKFVRSGHLLSDLRDRGGPFEPPLHFLSVFAALWLPIGLESAARVPSALAGALEVLALILLTREATGRRAPAVVAGALLAVAPYAVRYSQEARYYTMFSAFALLSWWLVVRAVRVRSRVGWAAYGASVAALLLTHPFAPLVLVAQAGWLVVRSWWVRRSEANPGSTSDLEVEGIGVGHGYSGALLLAAVLTAPWYIYGALRWLPDLRDGKSYTVNKSGAIDVRLEPDLLKRVAEWLLGNATHATVLAVALLLAMLLAPFVASGRDRVVAIVAGGLGLTIFVMLVPLAREMGTYYAMRRIEALLPIGLMVAALGFVGVADRLRALGPPRAAVVVTGLALTFVLVLGARATASYYKTEKTDYREFARVIRGAPADAAVVVGPVDVRTVPWIKSYMKWKGIHRPVHYFAVGYPPPKLPLSAGGVLWLTGVPPNVRGLSTRPLNDVGHMQVIAGDRSVGQSILPWYASRSHPHDRRTLDRQRLQVSVLPPFLPAP